MQHSPNESKIPIPPNLLKNFNVYDILEPQKNGAINSDATKVDKLVDIDDSSKDSGIECSDLNASFFDKNRDFDLVDLFQNIFVTPQHIKQKETASSEIDGASNFSAVRESDVDFNNFFDMLESGQKIDWTNIGQSKNETISKYDFIEGTPKVLVPKVFDEPDSDAEDLINEVLTQKTLEKLVLGNVSHTPKLQSDSPKKVENADVSTEFSRLNLNNSLNKDSKFETGTNEVKPRPEPKPSSLNTQINNSLLNFTVRAIQKDEKVYKKKRLQKPDHLKATYTKGPDFYEKSVVLPQIMARLNARLDYLDEIGNHKKRLILDGGTKPSNNQPESSTSNCEQNKRKINQAECSTASLHVKTKIPNIQSSSGINSLKTPIQKDPRLCNIIQKIQDSTTKEPLGYGSQTAGKQTSTQESKSEFGQLSPIVLMEDCNRERLRALKQSQRFKDFVLKGKYEF